MCTLAHERPQMVLHNFSKEHIFDDVCIDASGVSKQRHPLNENCDHPYPKLGLNRPAELSTGCQYLFSLSQT